MLKYSLYFFCLIFLFSLGIYFHTNSLVITHHQVQLNKGKHKLRLAHITDLHTKGTGRLERQLIEALDKNQPDLIFITGDLATPNGTLQGYKGLLNQIKAPKGTYFVQGNWENWEPIPEIQNLLEKTGITDLTNQAHQLDHNLWLVGFDDSETGRPKLDVLDKLPQKALKIGLFHSPQFFDQTAGLIQLNFAGHSHGGQIRLPFLPGIWLPAGTGNYDQGWFEKAGSRLFVSRGIGTSIFPIRFNCSPELAFIDISY